MHPFSVFSQCFPTAFAPHRVSRGRGQDKFDHHHSEVAVSNRGTTAHGPHSTPCCGPQGARLCFCHVSFCCEQVLVVFRTHSLTLTHARVRANVFVATHHCDARRKTTSEPKSNWCVSITCTSTKMSMHSLPSGHSPPSRHLFSQPQTHALTHPSPTAAAASFALHCKADAVCIVFSADDEESMVRVGSYWVPLITACLPPDAATPVLVIGNKVATTLARERERVCVCVCVRERESVCMLVCMLLCMLLCVILSLQNQFPL